MALTLCSVVFLVLQLVLSAHGLSNSTSLTFPSKYQGTSAYSLLTSPDDSDNLFVLMRPQDGNNGFVLLVDANSLEITLDTPFNLPPYSDYTFKICSFYQPDQQALVIVLASSTGSVINVLDSTTLQPKQGCTVKTQTDLCYIYSSYDAGIVTPHNLYLLVSSGTGNSFLQFAFSTCSLDETPYVITPSTSDLIFVFGFALNETQFYAHIITNSSAAEIAQLEVNSQYHTLDVITSTPLPYFGGVGCRGMPNESPPSILYLSQSPSPGSVTLYSLFNLSVVDNYNIAIPGFYQIAEGLVMGQDSFFVLSESMMDGNGYFNQYSLTGDYQDQIPDTEASTAYVSVGDFILFGTQDGLQRYSAQLNGTVY